MASSRHDIKAVIIEKLEADGVSPGSYEEATDAEMRWRLIREVEAVLVMLEKNGMVRRLGNRWASGETHELGLGNDSGEHARLLPFTTEEITRAIFPGAFQTEYHVYHRWEDAMIEQLKLHDFSTSHMGRRYLLGFEERLNAQHPPATRVERGFLAAVQALTLRNAEPVYVGADICDLVDEARWSWKVETIMPSDPFVPEGFCLLAKPIALPDAPWTAEQPFRAVDGHTMIRAIAWTSIHSEDMSQGAFWISFYSHTDDDFGHVLTSPEERRKVTGQLNGLLLAHSFQWSWSEEKKTIEDRLDGIALPGEDMEMARFRAQIQGATVQSFWRLGQQFVPVPTRAPRALRRDTKRRLRREVSDVLVVLLRRAASHGDYVETDRHYTVSFIVHGYWAPRWVKKDPNQPPGGPLVKRPTWVRPHLKGEGPFQEKKGRAWEFIR